MSRPPSTIKVCSEIATFLIRLRKDFRGIPGSSARFNRGALNCLLNLVANSVLPLIGTPKINSA